MAAAGLRVAICFGTFPPERNGGSDFVARFAGALAGAGTAVHVLTSAGGGHSREELPSGVVVHRVVEDWSIRSGSRGAADAVIAENDVQVVHVLFPDSVVQKRYQLPVAIGVGRVPLVTTYWNLGLGRRSPPPLRLASLALLARSGVVSSHDPTYVAALRRLVLGLKPVRWLPVGSNFEPVAASSESAEPGSFTLGFFGQLDFTRGVDTLFEALARVRQPGVRLRMLGSASRPERYADDPAARAEFGRLRALPGRLGIASAVEWTGFLADDEVPRALAALDLCVLPYRRNSLGRSALAAALQSGVPVVLGGTPAGIVPLRDREHVALVPPDDPEALARTIDRLACDAGERARLADGGRRAGRLFAWPRIAATAQSLYREALR